MSLTQLPVLRQEPNAEIFPVPKTVYVETTIVSYLVARPSRDVVIFGHQSTTLEWWENRLP